MLLVLFGCWGWQLIGHESLPTAQCMRCPILFFDLSQVEVIIAAVPLTEVVIVHGGLIRHLLLRVDQGVLAPLIAILALHRLILSLQVVFLAKDHRLTRLVVGVVREHGVVRLLVVLSVVWVLRAAPQ